MIIKINGEELATAATNILYTATPSSVPWWDISSQIDLAMENLKESATEFFTDIILGFLQALADVLVDLSYSAALLGGGILIIVKAVTGIKKVDQWLAVLMLVHVLIQFLLG